MAPLSRVGLFCFRLPEHLMPLIDIVTMRGMIPCVAGQQDKHVAGLKDVVSIGAGQKAESLAAMGVCGNNVKTINTSMLAMAAVFKYLPATKVSIYSAVLQSVFIKPVDYTLVKLKRTFILDLGLQGLLGSKQPMVTCSNLAIQGVFRYASPRIETIIMNLKYPIMV